jgi:hypothetical protein
MAISGGHTPWKREDEREMELTEFPEGGKMADAEKILIRNGPIFRGVLSPGFPKGIKANKLAWEKKRIEFGKEEGGERIDTEVRAEPR